MAKIRRAARPRNEILQHSNNWWRKRVRKPGIGPRLASFLVRRLDVSLDTEKPLRSPPRVKAGLHAAQHAVHLWTGRELLEIVNCLTAVGPPVTPAVADIGADVESGPGIDHRRSINGGLHRHIGSRSTSCGDNMEIPIEAKAFNSRK